MCRLMAITFTDRKLQRFKPAILDRMLLMSQTDDNQNDGWGVTDGTELLKTNAMYSVSIPEWKKMLDPAVAWMAHIRKASTTTGRSPDESHPYLFDMLNGDRLYAAHNGFIYGTDWNIDKKVEGKLSPNTDSWRAFCRLHLDMLEEEKTVGFTDLLPALIEKWTPNFEENSQFAMLFHWRGNVVALRHDRPLHCMRVGNGHIVHTSIEFLRILADYLKSDYNIDSEKPLYIDKDNMVVFTVGRPELVVHKLDLKFKPRVTYAQNNAAWQGHGGSNAGNVSQTTSTTAQNPSVNLGESSGEQKNNDVNKEIYSRPVTKPRPRAPVAKKEDSTQQAKPILYLPDGRAHTPSIAEKKAEITDPFLMTKVSLWRKLVKDFIPLRNSMSTFWAIIALGYEDVKPGQFLRNVSVNDLRLFERMVCKKPIFTERQNCLLNAWNHLVVRGKDVELHERWCGTAFFWMNPRYNKPSKNENHFEAVSRFQADLINFVFSEEVDTSLYLRFDTDKLVGILEASSPRTVHLGAD